MANNTNNLLLLLLLFFSSSTAKPDDGELQALLTIKRDWGNPAAFSSWKVRISNSSTHCNWAGVACSNGQVIALSLAGFQIANTIPASICSLKNLQYLDLSYNNLTGDFPKLLYACSALQYLDLSNNELTGSLPNDIDKLSSEMLHLNLSSNAFIGDVPLAIGQFSKLKSLVLDTNSFNGSYPGAAIGGLVELEKLTLASNPFIPAPIPDEFGQLTKLTYLWLSWMNLTGAIPKALSALTELTLLDISQNKMQGEIPEWIWKLEKLEMLYLFANNFSGEIGHDITALNLQELDVSMNKLTGSIPEAITKLKNLRLLYMYFNNFIGPIPEGVGMLPNLTDIRLFDNKLSGPLPPELGKYSELGNFEVSNNNLSGKLPDTLCFNKQLYDIVVFNNSFSGMFPANLGECDTINNIMAYNNHFAGDFPEKIWSFALLTNVMIQDNNFTGTLPSNISPNISRIEMGNNRFSGAIPSSAIALKNFKAENNQFSGALPDDMSRLTNLTELELAGNRLSGSIPPSIRSLTRLTSLNLSSNQISGEIPAALGWMDLNMLDLSNNELTGNIPQEFNHLHLNFLNLSSNQLTGEVPEALQNVAYEGSFHKNRDLCAMSNMDMILHLPQCGSGYGAHNKLSISLITVFSVLASVAFISVVAIWLLILRHQKRRQDLAVWKMTPFRTLEFSECDILNNLHEDNVIGSGGSGKVFRIDVGGKGNTGKVVAVKRLWRAAKSDAKTDKEFDAEVRILGEARHNNIVNLLCCISSDDTKLLVYEYMENGSLDQWLHHRDRDAAPAPLHWPTRLIIAIDAARGLSYMHHECAQPIVHRDVKSSNILLDLSFHAKIADFGLARILVKSGSIPPSIRSLTRLTSLNLSSNQISGEIPVALGWMDLNILDLSDNELTGGIPQEFNHLNLNFLNLSSNQLTGEVPEALQNVVYAWSFLDNPSLCCRPESGHHLALHIRTCAKSSTHDHLALSIIVVLVVLPSITLFSVAITGWLLLFRRKNDLQDVTSWKMTQFRTVDFTEHDIIRNISESNVIGRGGSGKVYRIHLNGDIKAGGRNGGCTPRIVAVKKIGNTDKLGTNLDKEFESEVRTLGDLRHSNIIDLLCCISSQETKLLVYEHMENGSLDQWLHRHKRTRPLNWPTRLNIAVDVARGLNYMHEDFVRPVIHRDVKCSNILLDCRFRAKIADFGLARILAKSGESESASAVCGTFGYIAPEYISRAKVSVKVDVYSFGVVLLELATGRGAQDGGTESGSCLAKWASKRYNNGGPIADLVDDEIQDPAYLDDMVAVFELGVVCTGEEPESRPPMSEVLHRLLQHDRSRTCSADIVAKSMFGIDGSSDCIV